MVVFVSSCSLVTYRGMVPVPDLRSCGVGVRRQKVFPGVIHRDLADHIVCLWGRARSSLDDRRSELARYTNEPEKRSELFC